MDSRAILGRLVGFASVSREPNRPLIDWVRNWLLDHGIDSELVAGPEDGKANLYARIGPERAGGLVLSGHTDVVPTDGQHWTSDPFVLTERDGRLHGRGAADMKGFIASVLARVPDWAGGGLERPVHIAFSCDEEIGCLGAPRLIAAMAARGLRPDAVVVGEPTGLRVANRHKGIRVLQTVVEGSEGHSSLTHQGVSAIMVAGEVIARIGELAQTRALRDDAFVPPTTSASVNLVRGGTAINMFAARCDFTWDLRTLPQDSADAFVAAVMSDAGRRTREWAAAGIACGVHTRTLADVPALAPRATTVVDAVARAARHDGAPIALPFSSEAGQFQAEGWPTVVCGPGAIEQAHQPDEYIGQAELAACDAFLERLVAAPR